MYDYRDILQKVAGAETWDSIVSLSVLWSDVADYKAFKNFNSKIHIHMPYIYIYR